MSSVYTEEIKRYYSEWWENPKDIRNVVFDKLNQYVRMRLPPGKGRKALDIGSGHGRIVSYLIEKGYEVTAVEFSEEFINEIRAKFPEVKVTLGDVRNINFDAKFDIVTCIELVQNLDKKDLLNLLVKLAGTTKFLLINISNKNSFHARWVKFRGWANRFVFAYTPKEFDQLLEQAGFTITHRRGIGLITPVSLFKNFKGKLIPVRLAKVINKLDLYATRICHLYYVEAVSQVV